MTGCDQAEPAADQLAAERTSLVDGAEAAVRDWLAPGRFRPGDRLPPEQELAAMLGVSRGTLRSALRRLERNGEVIRRQGSGTFVGSLERPGRIVSETLRVDSYSLWAGGERFTVGELTIEHRETGAEAAASLGVSAEDVTTALGRTIVAAGRVAGVTSDVFHPEVTLPDPGELRRQLLDSRTVWEVLAQTATPATSSRTRISALLLTPHEPLGERLQLEAPTACVALEELASGERGEPLLWSWDVIVPGVFEIEVRQSTGSLRPDPVLGTADSRG